MGLRHDKPSIDVDRLPGNVGGVIRSKKAHQSRNVFGVPPAFKGNSLNPFFHQFARLIITEKLPPMLVVVSPHVGLDDSGANGIHRNAVGRQFLSQALGKADHCEFAGRIMRGVNEALPTLRRHLLISRP